MKGLEDRPDRADPRKARFQGQWAQGNGAKIGVKCLEDEEGGASASRGLLSVDTALARDIMGGAMDISKCVKTDKRMVCVVSNPKKLRDCPRLTCLSPPRFGKESCLDSTEPTVSYRLQAPLNHGASFMA